MSRLWGRRLWAERRHGFMRGLLALIAAFLLVATPLVPATPVSAAVEQWETFHGCVVTVGDDYVVIRIHGAGAGPNGLHRFGLTGATAVDTGLTGDACIAVVAWKEDGQWYAQSITAERDSDGDVEVTRRRRG
jgi:hypothetical protein